MYIATEANYLCGIGIRSGASYKTLIFRDIGVHVLYLL